MSNQIAPLELTLQGDPAFGDRVTLATFAESVVDWVTALRQETAELSGRKPAVEWVIQDLRNGSAVLSCDPVSRAEEGELVAREVARRIIVATNQATRGGNPAHIVSEKTAHAILRLIRRVEDREVPAIRLRSGDLLAEIVPSLAMSEQPRSITRRAIGSVEGDLLAVSFAGLSPSFTVRDRLNGNLVPCYFDADRFAERVIAGLRRRVAVSGALTERANGEVASMTEVEAIYFFPPVTDLPQPSDVVGIAPDLTEGLTAEEWVGRQRA
jgi:hypothetical protein